MPNHLRLVLGTLTMIVVVVLVIRWLVSFFASGGYIDVIIRN